jgi:branched-chain amino acid transport system substrate-binding protein
VAGPMSGQNAAFGEQMQAGVQAAVDLINSKGGLNGELLSVAVADDGCDARRAVAAAQGFVAKDVRFVVGHFCSGATLAAAEIYGKADIVVMSPTASNSKVTESGHWNVLRLAARDDGQAVAFQALAQRELAGEKIAVVSDGTALLAGIADKVSAALRIKIAPGGKAFPDAVQAIRDSGATAVYLACGGAEAGTLAGDLKDAGLTLKIFGPDSLLVDAFWERSGEAGEGARASFPADPATVPQAQSLVARLRAANIPAEGATIASYAAVEIFVAAAKSGAANDGKALARALKSGATYASVLGTISFDGKGDVNPQQFDWYRWSLGSYAREQALN